MPDATRDVQALSARFDVPGRFVGAAPYGTGHINETWAVTCETGGRTTRYILQRVNAHVFRAPEQLMDNVARLLAHVAPKLAGRPDAARRALTLVPARDGRPWILDDVGELWRLYHFIERTRTVDVVETPEQAEAAARAFGEFGSLLADLPAPRLHETIPGFHDTRSRVQTCLAAIDADACNRAAEAGDAVQFAQDHTEIADRIQAQAASGDLPERVTHNDTKINNVLMDEVTGEGLCVVDLDTTMPGYVAYDFGDMVRTATNAGREDEADVTRVRARPEIFEALVRGYLAGAGDVLTRTEVAALAGAGAVLAYEQGVRFLSDHLVGDVYYRCHRPGHNLDRARAQFALVTSLESQRDAFERVVHRVQS